MIDAAGDVQRVLVLGGTSELGLAIARRFVVPGREIEIVLAGRSEPALADAAGGLSALGARTRVVPFEARAIEDHAQTIDVAWEHGDVDVVVIAFGQLGDQAAMLADPVAAADLIQVNTVGAISVGVAAANRLRRQGYGTIIAISSIAAARARPQNFIYGASKAGLDVFFDGLGHELKDSGVNVIVLRPGFVRTRMTAGLEAPPFASDVEDVATVARASVGRVGPAFVSPSHRAIDLVLRLLPRRMVGRLP